MAALPERPRSLADRLADARWGPGRDGLPGVRRTQCLDEATGAIIVVETRWLASDGIWQTSVYPLDAPLAAESPEAAVAWRCRKAWEAGDVHDEAVELVRLALASTARRHADQAG